MRGGDALFFQEYKLMYGMLFSIRSFVSKMSPLDMKEGFLAFQTSKYKLHYYETPTGIKVVMNTDLGVGNIRDVLHQIYSNVNLTILHRPLPPPNNTTAPKGLLDSQQPSLPRHPTPVPPPRSSSSSLPPAGSAMAVNCMLRQLH
uniref:Trafficking protein particle complex subunit n=1 Tax=Sphenodon punctatus TaxID=8508 RepID=A0A8D0HNW4_SPHPU